MANAEVQIREKYDFVTYPTESGLALVKTWFYPNNVKLDPYRDPPSEDTRKAAVSKVKTWLWQNPRLDHAIVVTAGLMEALLLHDEQRQPGRSEYISRECMQSILGMAFIKFVNGFVDRDVGREVTGTLAVSQDEEVDGMDELSDDEDEDELEDASEIRVKVKGGGESSMYANAARIGMPEAFVDFRHTLVHERQSPGVDSLRYMTEEALQWLWEKWWVKNATGNPRKAQSEVDRWVRIKEEGSGESKVIGIGVGAAPGAW